MNSDRYTPHVQSSEIQRLRQSKSQQGNLTQLRSWAILWFIIAIICAHVCSWLMMVLALILGFRCYIKARTLETRSLHREFLCEIDELREYIRILEKQANPDDENEATL